MNEAPNHCKRPCCDATQQAETRRLYADAKESARLFRALGDETRLAILRQLRERGETCACDLQACCVLAQPTVSHHLQILRRAGLVRADKRGAWVYYSLNEEKLALVKALVP